LLANHSSHVRYKETIRELSDRMVEVQRPIRILDAIKWDNSVQEAFFRSNCTELPPVDRKYYDARPLSFDPVDKRRQFHELELEIQRKLGLYNPIGVIMRRMCREYETVVRMLEARGLPEFTRLSRQLYGSATDAFHAGDPTLADLGDMMAAALTNIETGRWNVVEEKTISGEQAVQMLDERLKQTFPDPQHTIRVALDDGIISDAAAGTNYLKIRAEARFTPRDIRLMEVHEGWVHLGTTFNGMRQPVCTFLSKGPPSSTVTQEGLAILMEIMAFASHPSRVRRVTNRIRAVALAESGANFLDVFRFFCEHNYNETDSFWNAARVFRGSLPDGGPFTKDLTYSKGFVLIYNYVLLAVRRGLVERIPLLFCGKTTLEDLRTLGQAVDEGIVSPPEFLPQPFADLNALAAWMCYSNFLARLSLDRIEADYANIL
jgi:uncharacterized protein (TIGR02421 family)